MTERPTRCRFCGATLPPPSPTGRPRAYCSGACRQRAYATGARGVWFDPDRPCPECGDPLVDKIELDHLVPVSAGGTSMPYNLRYIHARCNKQKGSRVPEDTTIYWCPDCGYWLQTMAGVTHVYHLCRGRHQRPMLPRQNFAPGEIIEYNATAGPPPASWIGESE